VPGDLFPETLGATGLHHLAGFAAAEEAVLIAGVEEVSAQAAFRQMSTPGGKLMSVAMTNCGNVGWVSDRRGYRYSAADPETQLPWPAMPEVFSALAGRAAAVAGFIGFVPDACLINRYVPGAKMSLHQDADERDFGAPIVSVSLGLPAVFLWGGAARADKASRIALESGDVVVWGGDVRRYFHGIAPLREGAHPVLGRVRFNLTFRKAL